MTDHAVTVKHNFETAHRLPHLAGKCVSLHGHSWWASITIAAPTLSAAGTVVEFGPFKRHLRAWIDSNLDHGTMLGVDDPLYGPLLYEGCKVYQFGGPDPHGYAQGLSWPTVENVATVLARVAADIVGVTDVPPGAHVASVTVRETHVNAATWSAP